MCLSRGTTPSPIALENCSNPKDSASLQVWNEKKIFGFGFRFLVSDVISEVGL